MPQDIKPLSSYIFDEILPFGGGFLCALCLSRLNYTRTTTEAVVLFSGFIVMLFAMAAYIFVRALYARAASETITFLKELCGGKK